MPTTKAASRSGYELKVTILGIEPPVWRTIQVSADTTLAKLHRIIQVAFGWEDCHLHEFLVGKERFGPPNQESWGSSRAVDERRVSLADLGLRRGRKLKYVYDFGDDWEHEATIARVLEEAPPKPTCVGGGRAGPPEDCGGAGGYDDLLQAIADRDHPQHEDASQWLGDAFDPEAFDAATVTAALRRIR